MPAGGGRYKPLTYNFPQIADAPNKAGKLDMNLEYNQFYGVQILGITYVEGLVKGSAKKGVRVKFLVDSGASYTLLPFKDWKRIKLTPKRSVEFTLADGTVVTRNVSECHINLPQGEGHTPVILGEPDDQALLGVVTLEILGLVLDPFRRILQPMRLTLRIVRAG